MYTENIVLQLIQKAILFESVGEVFPSCVPCKSSFQMWHYKGNEAWPASGASLICTVNSWDKALAFSSLCFSCSTFLHIQVWLILHICWLPFQDPLHNPASLWAPCRPQTQLHRDRKVSDGLRKGELHNLMLWIWKLLCLLQMKTINLFGKTCCLSYSIINCCSCLAECNGGQLRVPCVGVSWLWTFLHASFFFFRRHPTSVFHG